MEYFQLNDDKFVARQFYRVNHDTTMWRAGLPEVFRLEPDIHVILTEPVQRLWRALNPHLTDEQWTLCLGNTLEFTNGTGFPGRHNYITGADADKEDPKFDQTRICGGATICGAVSEGNLIIQAIDVRFPLPPVEYVRKRRWLWYEAVNIDVQKGTDGVFRPVIRPLKGAWGKKVYVPLLSSRLMTYPLQYLTKIPLYSIPPSNYQYP